MLRNLGDSEKEIRKLIWEQAGLPLAKLGRHQDTGLIGTIETVAVDDREVQEEGGGAEAWLASR